MSSARGASIGTKGKSKVTRSSLEFPVGKVAKSLENGKYSEHVSVGASAYLAAVLQYMAAKVLELSGKEAKNEKYRIIKPRHIESAIRSDPELSELLSDVTIPGSGKNIDVQKYLEPKSTGKKNGDFGSGSK